VGALALAVALLGSMLVFLGHSLSTMTQSAVRSVPLDWQGPVSSYGQVNRLAARVAREPDVKTAAPTATAPFAGMSHHAAAGTSSAGQGSILAVPPSYQRQFGTFRYLHGSLRSNSIVLDQQLAATLQAKVGDTVTVTPTSGSKPVPFKVSGVGLVTAPDVLFQPLNPLLGPAPAQPPSDIAILPTSTFAQRLAPKLHSIPAQGGGVNAVPGAQTGIQWQVQAQVSGGALTGSPSNALKQSNQIRNRVESDLTGRVQFVDNLSDSLTTAAGDALYAQALYIMLAVPGALVALGLAYMASLGTAERDRRDLALMRARGAGRRSLVGVALAESAVLGLLGGLIGAGLAFAAASLLIKGGLGLTTARVVVTVAACVVVAVAGAAAARMVALSSAIRASVSEARRTVLRERRPLWQRLWLDVVCLALSGLVYWLTVSTGFSAVVNPDSNPTLSLSVYMFFAPALLWIGATLLVVRLRGRGLAWAARRASGSGAGRFVLASAGRRGAAINRGLLLVGLLLAFGVNLAIFTATYDQQANVDAQLTLGADVVASAPPGAIARHNLEARVASAPGVAATSAVDHSYAYVGPDLQDVFGIDPKTIARATTLRDSYFVGGTVPQILQKLRSTPDGVLVAQETITDYSLKPGDLLRLRVLDHRTGNFHVVPFHVIGVVTEFPSAPRDSFMVANRSYLVGADHGGGPNVVFARSTGDPTAAAKGVAAALHGSGATVRNVRQQTAQTVTSLTTVSLQGISRIEEAFTITLAAAALVAFVAITIAERRHELATMAALRAPRRRIAAFVWAETALVVAAGLALAAVLGWLLSEMLVAMLQHVFDPPPDHLAIPWGYLALLGGATIAAAVGACALATRAIGRLDLGRLLREQ
jgi:putative ABC transport system permease protein